MPEHFSTAVVHPRDRLAYWHGFVCASLVQADCTVRRDQPCSGEVYVDLAREPCVVEAAAPTVSYTAEELAAKRARRDPLRLDEALTQEEIEARFAADPDEAGTVIDWDSATIEMPQPKATLNMRIDRDVLDYFRQTGKGYQTRNNAILRSYVARMLEKDRFVPGGATNPQVTFLLSW
jgi:uncharacterized protein (DUF4415 family)